MSHFRFLVCSRFNYRQFVIPLIFGKKGGLNYLNFEIAGFDLRNVTVSSIFSLIFICANFLVFIVSNKNDSMPESIFKANQILQTNLTQIGNKMAGDMTKTYCQHISFWTAKKYVQNKNFSSVDVSLKLLSTIKCL